MGMQSLRTKIRRRKYKLGVGDDSSVGYPRNIKNVTSEWQFENFKPWASVCKTAKVSSSSVANNEQQQECQRHSSPRQRVPSPPAPPVPPRYSGLLAYLPRRPSTWTPNQAPPVPPHSWEVERLIRLNQVEDIPPAVPPHAPGALRDISGETCAHMNSNSPLGDKQSASSVSTNTANGKPQNARERRPGMVGSEQFGDGDKQSGHLGSHSSTLPNMVEFHTPVSGRKKIVSRSESLRERAQRKHHREQRKHSDPNLPPSQCSDVDTDGRAILSSNNSGSSSNSSLTFRSLETPNSSDMVSSIKTPGGLSGTEGISITIPTSGSGGVTPWDSDIEADGDPPEWTRNLDPAILEGMPAKEKQRQEVINELFHTERSYVRNLKVLERVFYKPLLENGLLPAELMNLLFPNLPELLRIHSQFNDLMKSRKKEQPVVKDVVDILSTMFESVSGDNLKRAAAFFCRNQSVALESLRDRRKKDSKLQSFLSEAEGNPVCRRLQLKDIIPCTMQRLTKYPLLLESLLKYTPSRSPEAAAVKAALERSKEILNYVNQAVKEAENYQRLVEIQKRLDKSAFEKNDFPSTLELKNLDVTKHRLLYEGSLTWRIKGQKNIDVHVLLLEDLIVLLQKQDEKFILKIHNVSYPSGKEETRLTHSPLIHIRNVLVRPVATDKLAFFLVNTGSAQIYDLVAASVAERKAWFRHITEATEANKAREGGRNKRQDYPAGSAGSSGTPPLSASSSFGQLENSPDPPEKQKEGETEQAVSAGGNAAVADEEPPTGAAGDQNENADAKPAECAKTNGESTNPSLSPTLNRSDTSASSAPRRRLQRVEILKIADGTPLIDPTEVRISQDAVLTAEPVLTPLEKIRRKDQLIRTALADKQRLVADVLHVPHGELDFLAEAVDEKDGEKEARLLVLAAINQASHLTAVLNETLRLTEEEAIAAVSEPNPFFIASGAATSPRTARRINRMPGTPAPKLLPISAKLNRNLTELLGLITQRDEERDQLRRELRKAHEQIALLLQMRSSDVVDSSPASSRPLSSTSASSETDDLLEARDNTEEDPAFTSQISCLSQDVVKVDNPTDSDDTQRAPEERKEKCNVEGVVSEDQAPGAENEKNHCEAVNEDVVVVVPELHSGENTQLTLGCPQTSEA